MKRVLKKNQMVLTLLAVMIAVAGYMNYIGKPGSSENQGETEEAAMAVNPMQQENEAALQESQPGEAVFTSSDIVEFISQVNLNKEQIRSENKELLLEIINNENLSEGAKQDAVDQMVQMADIAEKENETETLLAAKGFDNAVVSITEDAVDVVVGRSEITDAEKAQIEDIVTRKTEMPVDQVVISLMTYAADSDEVMDNTGTDGELETEEESLTVDDILPEETE
ncbi:MAG: SpoIIIAH-like family protein [Clostridiales bacterium]|nr:SpoIIIAH-like family protein [Clostridiales bacterium]